MTRNLIKAVGGSLIGAIAAVGFSAYAAQANPKDVAQADKFLHDLPASCAKSRKETAADGTVTIHIDCTGNGKKMNGVVAIKDGVVTRIE